MVMPRKPNTVMVTGRCLHTNHTWHDNAWWHDPDNVNLLPLPTSACPQRLQHRCLKVTEPCGLCLYGVGLSMAHQSRKYLYEAEAEALIRDQLVKRLREAEDRALIHGGGRRHG